MERNYDELSAEEMRELILQDKLNHNFMSEEDYIAVLDYEAFLGAPNEKTLDFCYAGLTLNEKYRDIEIPFNINTLIDEFENRNNVRKGNKTKPVRIIRLLVSIIAAIIVLMLSTQLIGMAFGFDFFGFIFNWNEKEVVGVSNLDSVAPDSFESVITEYTESDKIPDEMKSFSPDYLFKNYQFDSAVCISDFSLKYQFNFTGKEGFLSLTVTDSGNTDVEKDENTVQENYTAGNQLYTVFTNMDNYQVIWVKDGWFYHLYTQISLDELKEILNNLY